MFFRDDDEETVSDTLSDVYGCGIYEETDNTGARDTYRRLPPAKDMIVNVGSVEYKNACVLPHAGVSDQMLTENSFHSVPCPFRVIIAVIFPVQIIRFLLLRYGGKHGDPGFIITECAVSVQIG